MAAFQRAFRRFHMLFGDIDGECVQDLAGIQHVRRTGAGGLKDFQCVVKPGTARQCHACGFGLGIQAQHRAGDDAQRAFGP